jgi:D-3-phosphoglycerate dehydrogenase
VSDPTIYVALTQFCETDDQPKRVLTDAGFRVRENRLRRRLKREEVVEALADADAVIAGLEPYDGEILRALPRLRCISRCGLGTDSIDRAAAESLGIAVLTTASEVSEPVAQLTVAMILALARELPQCGNDLRQGRWQRRFGHMLSEWTIGLIGFGRIGRLVEHHLRSFEPRILVADPYVDASALPKGVERQELPHLLAESDLVSLHAERRRDDGPLIGEHELGQMKPGARLVNTARGYLVDEHALYDALVAGRLSGAALDVFCEEPYAGKLLSLPQVLCTPHVGSSTWASRQAMELRSATNVIGYFSKRVASR